MATILVVDDEFGVAEVLEALLADEGHHVMTAMNGRQALSRLVEMRPDAMLLDFMMPLLDGAGVMRAIQSDPALMDLPVVIMSSLPETAIMERITGYAAFLRKPFRIGEVLSALAVVLGAP